MLALYLITNEPSITINQPSQSLEVKRRGKEESVLVLGVRH